MSFVKEGGEIVINNLATPIQRLLAFLIDVLIIGVINFVIALLLGGNKEAANPIVSILNLAVTIGYWVFYQEKYGQTIGKKTMNIKVVMDDGGTKPTAMAFFLREIIGKFISGIALLLGYVWILIDKRRQGWHDKIVHTLVVKV